MRIVGHRQTYIWYELLAIIFASIFLTIRPAMAADWSWDNDYPIVISSVAAVPTESWCQTAVFEIHYVAGDINPVRMCMMQNQKVRFGLYYDGNYGYLAAIGFSDDSLMYKIDGGCAQEGECLYLPNVDMMAKKEYLTPTSIRSMVIYKNYSQHLIQYFDVAEMANKYKFDDSAPDYVFGRDDGTPYLVGGLGTSNNNKWLAIEIYNNGISLLNLDTFQMRVISSISYSYTMGYSPRAELAISNDGGHFAIMGVNASMYWFDITDRCSMAATDYNIYNAPFLPLCRPSPYLSYGGIDSPKDGLLPHFSDDGGQLDFFITSTDRTVSPRRVVLRAAGYPTKKLNYLALGDSYSSGEGETDDTHYLVGTNSEYEKCHTSDRSYPFELAKLIGVDQDLMKSVACSGATMPDLIGSDDSYFGQGNRLGVKGLGLNNLQLEAAQSLALSQFIPGRVHQASFVQLYQPSAITVGIGGNDAGFMEKLSGCLGPATCKWAGTDEGREKTAVEIKNLFGVLVDTYTKIHNKSPDSKIFAIGYPKIIDSHGQCNGVVNFLFDNIERDFITDSILYLNQIIASAANAAGVEFVDIYDAFGQHVICGSDNQPAVNAVMFGDDIGLVKNFRWLRLVGQESFHPNPLGHQLTANTIFQKIGNFDYKFSNAKAMSAGSVPEPPISLLPDGYHNYPLQKAANFASVQTTDIYNINLPQYSFEPNSPVSFEIEADFPVQALQASNDGSIEAFVNMYGYLPNGMYVMHLTGTSFSGELVDYYQVVKRISADVDDDTDQADVVVITIPDKEDHNITSVFIDTYVYTEPPVVSDIGSGYLASTVLDAPQVMGVATVKNAKVSATKHPKTWVGRDGVIPIIGFCLVMACITTWRIFKLKQQRRVRPVDIADNRRKR